jgi:hypothetical protein
MIVPCVSCGRKYVEANKEYCDSCKSLIQDKQEIISREEVASVEFLDGDDDGSGIDYRSL